MNGTTSLAATRCEWSVIEPWQSRYRAEMNCQILHDSFHRRPGWVEWYALRMSDVVVGYGAVVVAGPWAGTRSLFEVYVGPECRPRLLEFGELLVREAKVEQMDLQTNDRAMMVLLHQLGQSPVPDKVIFQRTQQSELPAKGAMLRRVTAVDHPRIFAHGLEPVGEWLLDLKGEIIATGGFLTHYNPPYVDVFVEVRADRRRQGFGCYLIQEISRVTENDRQIACGRCAPDHVGSIKAMIRAGMAPCAHRVVAAIKQ